jgi:O-antigen/teichoic acid export membrane protein
VSGFAGQFQNILLFHFLGASALAIFYFAVAPTEQMRSVTAQVEPILFPKVASDEWKIGSLWVLMKKSAPFLLMVTGGTLLYIGLAPFLFSIFFPKYMNAVVFSQLFAPIITATIINTALITIVKAKGMLKIQYLTNAIDTVFGLGINIALIYFFGLYGLIAGIMLMKCAELAVLVWTLFRTK